MVNNLDKAYQIATRGLRKCYGRHGIRAGVLHFKDYWSRDGLFASFGALRLKDNYAVKKMLENMLHFQKKNGQFPLRVSHQILALKYLGFKKRFTLSARYRPDFIFGIPLDQNSLFIITLCAYVEQTKNYNFAKKHIEQVRKALIWNIEEGGELLLKERGYANWADSIKKKGYVLYTNVCYFKCLQCFARLQKKLNDKRYKETVKNLNKLKRTITAKFWNEKGGYYYDWIDEKKKYDYFSTDGNLLAILWGLADKKKSKKIIDFVVNHHLDEPVPCRTNYPYYDLKNTSLVLRLIGLANYHNATMGWLWLGCVDALARYKVGKHESAKKELKHIADTIVQFKDVYEIYNIFGQPVNQLFYKSEHPFAWSAGLYVEAYNVIVKKKDSLL